jgi:hypothetical protein
LAIGIPDSVRNEGLSMGFTWDKPSTDIARVEALRSCLDLKNASMRARGLCRVVTTFSRQCISIATDPGGDGWGWAVEPNIAEAEKKALRSCVSTVTKACTIAASHCDTTP